MLENILCKRYIVASMTITNLKKEVGLIVAFLNDEIKWMSFFKTLKVKQVLKEYFKGFKKGVIIVSWKHQT